ncbi:dihydroxyacetone kinase subunit DhaL [Streptococcus pluranimalium]|uniref:phosphoenolpyruvate--glycerone phosphotransferase n=1 Tax=Streptococcus pluranimalium TaxID=82348 RepID=A0A345VIQ7_9STRE|nr:dihydroxyacetone kinase subunit DhaL [Streptococcus pluranimalium]AXJ12609.1 PTS-dependent dihydroxyacetone kinase, ADP-binding subunit DhaL [Streptococcus pluranimalium]
MTPEMAIKWMRLFNDKIQENKAYLSELDTPIGDGDHGGNMARGMAAVMENIDGKTFASADEVFKMVSMQLISKVGGASGPLYGSAFMGLTKALEAGQDLKSGLQDGLDMIKKRGKAEVGEKTMVDVWTPVLGAINDGQLTAELVDKTVEATKDLKATKGRASYVGERSIGHIDPGSFSSGLLFKSLIEAEVLNG